MQKTMSDREATGDDAGELDAAGDDTHRAGEVDSGPLRVLDGEGSVLVLPGSQGRGVGQVDGQGAAPASSSDTELTPEYVRSLFDRAIELEEETPMVGELLDLIEWIYYQGFGLSASVLAQKNAAAHGDAKRSQKYMVQSRSRAVKLHTFIKSTKENLGI